MNPIAYILIGLMIALGVYGYVEHSRFIKVRLEYDSFISETRILTAQQEAKHAVQISTAMAERDAANKRLSDNQARSRAMQRTLTAKSTGRICYSSDGLDSAYRELVSEIRAIAGEGQAGLIDNKAWASAWPK